MCESKNALNVELDVVCILLQNQKCRSNYQSIVHEVLNTHKSHFLNFLWFWNKF